MIRLNNISYNYRNEAEALKNVSASIGEGIHIMMGENGAGKSTMLHIMSGLLRPTTGECLIDEKNVWLRETETLEKVFFLDNNMPFPADTINETSRIHACFYPDFDRSMLEHNLARFRLTGEEKLSRLSFGNRQKALLSYAMSLRSRVLLLDEPTNGLDISSKQQLQTMLAECTEENQTVIISTHTVSDLENLYDGVIMLRRGELLTAMPTEEICTRLLFHTTMSPEASSIYSEMKLGLYHTITPNSDGEFCDMDYVAFYNAMHNDESRRLILSELKKLTNQ